MSQEYIIKLSAQSTVFQEAFTAASQRVKELEAQINKLQASANKVAAATQQVASVGVKPMTETVNGLNKSLTNANTAYMMFGGMAQGVSAQLIAGQNPIRVLAVQIPAVAQALSFMGFSLTSVLGPLAGVAAVAGLAYLGFKDFNKEIDLASLKADKLASSLVPLSKVTEDLRRAYSALTSTFSGGQFGIAPNEIASAFRGGRFSPQDFKAMLERLQKSGAMVNTGTEDNPQFILNPAIESLSKLRELQAKAAIDTLNGTAKERAASDAAWDEKIKNAKDFVLVAQAGNLLTKEETDQIVKQLELQKAKAAERIEQKAYFEFLKRQFQEQENIQRSILDRSSEKLRAKSNAEQKQLDFDFAQRTITTEQWASKSLRVVQQRYADERAAALLAFNLEKRHRDELIKQATDEKEKSKLRADAIVAENEYQKQIIEITARAGEQRIDIERQVQSKTKSIKETISDVRSRLKINEVGGLEAELAAIDYRYDREIRRVKDLNIALEEQKRLIDEINAAREKDKEDARKNPRLNDIENSPGTLGLFVAFSTDLEADESRRSEAEQRIRDRRVNAERKMWQDMLTIARASGREGFLAYKAMMIALAVVDTAKAAISAYQSVVGIPYVGPILAPIAAAAAVGAGVAQIAAITAATYQRGGYTGDGAENEPAGVVHRKEVVIPAPAVRMLGRGFTEGLARGVVDLSQLQGRVVLPQPITAQDTAAGRSVRQGMAGSGGTAPNVNVEGHKVTQLFYDERPHPKDYLASSEGEIQIVNIFKRQRLELGQPT